LSLLVPGVRIELPTNGSQKRAISVTRPNKA
jgi:hypothetical protein